MRYDISSRGQCLLKSIFVLVGVIKIGNYGGQFFSPMTPHFRTLLGRVVIPSYLLKIVLSVRPSNSQPRLIGSRYRNTFEPYDTAIVLVFAPNFVIVRLGAHSLPR